MTRSHILALLALVAAVPAAAIATNSLLSPRADDALPCFAAGNTGYQLTASRNADFTIRVDNTATDPDLVLQMAEDPARADFVLVDGAETSGLCTSLQTIRTIRVDADARDPDLTVALRPAGEPARYRIYASSSNFSASEAAALFAVMAQTGRRSAGLRNLIARTDGDVTGSLTPRSPRNTRQ